MASIAAGVKVWFFFNGLPIGVALPVSFATALCFLGVFRALFVTSPRTRLGDGWVDALEAMTAILFCGEACWTGVDICRHALLWASRRKMGWCNSKMVYTQMKTRRGRELAMEYKSKKVKLGEGIGELISNSRSRPHESRLDPELPERELILTKSVK
jgi:hypothetical protein